MAKRKPHSIQKRDTPLSRYLTSRRIRNRLTQTEVAERINKSKSWICRIERGKRQRQCLRGYILYQLADAYGADLGQVLKKANWPQLLLMNTSDEEKERLIQYLRETL